jgi:cell division protein ZapA
MSKKSLVNIQILNRDLGIICPDNEKAELFAAASYLDKKMRHIRDTSKTMDMDRIAITAALNIVHELLKLRQQPCEHVTKHNYPTQLKIFAENT